MAKKLLTSIKEIPTDASLVPANGWNKMDLKWVVTHDNMGSEYITFGRTVFAPGGGQHSLHRHKNAEEVIMVLRGKGISIVGKESLPMGPGDVCFIPKNEPHSFINESPKEECEIIFIYGGAPNLKKAGYEVVR